MLLFLRQEGVFGSFNCYLFGVGLMECRIEAHPLASSVWSIRTEKIRVMFETESSLCDIVCFQQYCSQPSIAIASLYFGYAS